MAAVVDALIDTNVMLDVYSCADLSKAYADAHAVAGDRADANPSVMYRIARARDSLLLCIYCNKMGHTTLGLHSEPLTQLLQRVPPADGTMDVAYTATFVHFVKDFVLPRWNSTIQEHPDHHRGNVADAALLALAREHNLPLITNEGNTVGGIVDKKLRAKAKAVGVSVFTPREFFEGKINEQEAVADFFAVLAREMPRYHLQSGHAPPSWLPGYYNFVLRNRAV